MLRHIATATRRQGALPLRRLHHDVAHPGRVYMLHHIDIGPQITIEQQRFFPRPRPLPASGHRQKQKQTPGASIRIESVTDPAGKKPEFQVVHIDLSALFGRFLKQLAFTVGAVLIVRFTWRTWELLGGYRDEMQRLAREAPTLDALEPDALAAHLRAFMLVFRGPLPPEIDAALERALAQGDAGAAAMLRTCQAIHATLLEHDYHRLTTVTSVFRAILRFAAATKVAGAAPADPGLDSGGAFDSGFSEPDAPPADEPTLQ